MTLCYQSGGCAVLRQSSEAGTVDMKSTEGVNICPLCLLCW